MGMANYIDETYVSNIMGAGVLSGSLTHGGTPQNVTGSVLAQFITGACSYVDTFLGSAGYSVPMTNAPAIVQELAGYQTAQRLLNRTNKPIPESWTFAINQAEARLMEAAVAKGLYRIPGQTPDTMGAADGGHNIGGMDSTSDPSLNSLSPLGGDGSSGYTFSRGNWKGVF